MKILDGAWSYPCKQINKGMIKVFDTRYLKGIASYVQKVFFMGVLQTKRIIKVIHNFNAI